MSDSFLQDVTMHNLCEEFRNSNRIDSSLYNRYHVCRGLRNADGSGVLAGLTNICNVHGYVIDDGEKRPDHGKLIWRGIDLQEIVNGCVSENRFGYEEVVFLLLFGRLPNRTELSDFCRILYNHRELPDGFAEDMIFKAPSNNIMNKLGRSVLALYSYDPDAEDMSVENLFHQSIRLIAQMPTIMVNAYQVKRRYFDHESMFFHPANPNHSMAEHILSTLRADRQFTDDEAHLLDLCLMLHAEHGGGNNSTFACRVLTSVATDTYSAISAAIGSLKGPQHGGANLKVLEQLSLLKEECSDYSEGTIADYLKKLLAKEAGDHSGLIYGMGHAVYTMSDPRAVILKENARALAEKNGYGEDFAILETIEKLTPKIISNSKNGGDARQLESSICANVDLYSGLVYRVLNIPPELFTPLFAVSRTAGWCAHRIEELLSNRRVIRPAYKSVAGNVGYTPLNER